MVSIHFQKKKYNLAVFKFRYPKSKVIIYLTVKPLHSRVIIDKF